MSPHQKTTTVHNKPPSASAEYHQHKNAWCRMMQAITVDGSFERTAAAWAGAPGPHQEHPVVASLQPRACLAGRLCLLR